MPVTSDSLCYGWHLSRPGSPAVQWRTCSLDGPCFVTPGNAGASDFGISPGRGLRPPRCGGQGLDDRTCCRQISRGLRVPGHLPRTWMCRTTGARREPPGRVSRTCGTAMTGSHAERFQGLCGQVRKRQRWPHSPPYSSFRDSGGAPSRARPRSGRSRSAYRACAAAIRGEGCSQYPFLQPEQPVRTSAECGLRPLHCLPPIIAIGHCVAGARGSSRGDPPRRPAPCWQPSTPRMNESCSVRAHCTNESGHRMDRARASECAVLPGRNGRVRSPGTG